MHLKQPLNVSKGRLSLTVHRSNKHLHTSFILTSELSREKDCSRIVSDKRNDQGLENQSNTSGDEISRSRNECNDKSTSRDDTNIRPSYDMKPMVEIPYTAGYNVFAIDTQHSEQPECIINICVVENVDSNIIPDSPEMYDNQIQIDQNVVKCDDERVALAHLIANLKLDVDENKKIQKQLKKANTSLAHELKECKSILAETSRTLGESNKLSDESSRVSLGIARTGIAEMRHHARDTTEQLQQGRIDQMYDRKRIERIKGYLCRYF
ncbi:hypothetical protein Tco_0080016 [Tanacetum coccineum]